MCFTGTNQWKQGESQGQEHQQEEASKFHYVAVMICQCRLVSDPMITAADDWLCHLNIAIGTSNRKSSDRSWVSFVSHYGKYILGVADALQRT